MSKEKKQKKNEERKDEKIVEVNEEAQAENGSESEELEACRKELEETKDKYLRAHADFENMKKRLEKEKANAVAFANESFATDLLTVVDSFESALGTIDQIEGDEAVEKIKEGMALTYEQLIKVLKKHGVEAIENEGVFDPHVHQVVQQVESEAHEKNEIVDVYQKGYKLKDRVLRPSMVTTKK
ncbi:nucleotide exchange factor GrpE [Nitratifractor sp.]